MHRIRSACRGPQRRRLHGPPLRLLAGRNLPVPGRAGAVVRGPRDAQGQDRRDHQHRRRHPGTAPDGNGMSSSAATPSGRPRTKGPSSPTTASGSRARRTSPSATHGHRLHGPSGRLGRRRRPGPDRRQHPGRRLSHSQRGDRDILCLRQGEAAPGRRPAAAVDGRAGPYAADWDGDGDLDLLVGAEDGSVSLYRNTGSAKSPELAAGVQLVPQGQIEYGPQAPKEPRRGIRSKICVADWNGDGRLDLLVGDVATQKPDRPDPTPEEQAEYDQIRKELEPIEQRFGELIQKLRGSERVRRRKRSRSSSTTNSGRRRSRCRPCTRNCRRNTKCTAGCGCSFASSDPGGVPWSMDIVVEPMTESLLLWRCLHHGPLSRDTIDQWPSGGEVPWERCRERNLPLLAKLTRTYGACAIVARDGERIVGHLRFYPKAVCGMKDAGCLCLQQDYPAGPAEDFAETAFPPLDADRGQDPRRPLPDDGFLPAQGEPVSAKGHRQRAWSGP